MQPLLAVGAPWESFAWVFLGGASALGLLALVSPRRFSLAAVRGCPWVDAQRWLSRTDRPVEFDTFVLPFSRWLGVAILTLVMVVGYLITQH